MITGLNICLELQSRVITSPKSGKTTGIVQYQLSQNQKEFGNPVRFLSIQIGFDLSVNVFPNIQVMCKHNLLWRRHHCQMRIKDFLDSQTISLQVYLGDLFSHYYGWQGASKAIYMAGKAHPSRGHRGYDKNYIRDKKTDRQQKTGSIKDCFLSPFGKEARFHNKSWIRVVTEDD